MQRYRHLTYHLSVEFQDQNGICGWYSPWETGEFPERTHTDLSNCFCGMGPCIYAFLLLGVCDVGAGVPERPE